MEGSNKLRNTAIVLAALSGIVLAIGYMSANSPQGKEKSRARAAIASCWAEQSRKSATPGQARFIAGACEGMEADFRRRFGVAP